jgi:peptidylprolyl isomerase domain and WD repeat-containing protein 1
VTVAIMQTTKGRVDLQLFPEAAPLAVENLRCLASRGYYDSMVFHRVIRNFIVQSGDSTGTGNDGRSCWGLPFPDEVDSTLKYDRPGRLGMVNRGPDTNESQFFITVVAAPWLDNRHTIFGQVVTGMEVVHAISEVETDQGRPVDPVLIDSLRIEER